MSQTRARIARAHSEHPPEINVEWDADEPPTRLYQGEPWLMPERTAPGQSRLPGPHPNQAPTRAAEGDADAERASMRVAPHHGAEAARRESREVGANHLPAIAEPAAPAASSSDPLERELHAMRGLHTHWQAWQAWQAWSPSLRLRASLGVAALLLGGVLWARACSATGSGAVVVITTAPAEARVSLDGHALAGSTSPFTARDVAPGQHALVIEKAGFATERQQLSVTDRAEQQLSVTLTPALSKTHVSVSSDPAGAEIFIDGQASGKLTPAALPQLAPGRHLVSLKLSGYSEAREALQLPQDGLLSIKLASLHAQPLAQRPQEDPASRAEARAQARELARERRAAARAAKVLLRYRARMGLPPDPVAQELVDAYGTAQSAVP